MELIIFIVVIVLCFSVYFYFRKSNPVNGTEKNYYYNRFLKNKIQLERLMEQLRQLISDYKCGGDIVHNGVTLQAYLTSVNQEYETNYANSILKTLKRNKLKNKEKRYYGQILINQSEKLYNVETELNALHAKYKGLAVF